jgi:hypothetical protein
MVLVLPAFRGEAQTMPVGSPPVSAAETPAEAITPEEEFPLWSRDLRRADIITFGSFPFTFFLANFTMDMIRTAQNDWDARYAPWPFKSAGAVNMTPDEYLITIGAAAGGAILVALADFIIVQVKRSRAARESARLAPGDPIITRRPWPEPPDTAPPGESGSGDDAANGAASAPGEAAGTARAGEAAANGAGEAAVSGTAPGEAL